MNGRWSKWAICGALVMGTAVNVSANDQPESVELIGTIRDFKMSHPDFESYPNTYNRVLDTLGPDGKPRLDTDYTGGKSVTSEETFAEWFTDVPGKNIEIPHPIRLDRNEAGIYVFARDNKMPSPNHEFFPIDGQGFGRTGGAGDPRGNKEYKYYSPKNHNGPANHNYHFTYEIETSFVFTPRSERDHELKFNFTGDDDVWVFINGKLAVDLGGVHSQEAGWINLDTGEVMDKRKNEGSLSKRTINIAEDLELEEGKTYKLKLFFAERCTTDSNFRIETTLRFFDPNSLLFD